MKRNFSVQDAWSQLSVHAIIYTDQDHVHSDLNTDANSST